jgi:hypothetical protein
MTTRSAAFAVLLSAIAGICFADNAPQAQPAPLRPARLSEQGEDQLAPRGANPNPTEPVPTKPASSAPATPPASKPPAAELGEPVNVNGAFDQPAHLGDLCVLVGPGGQFF